MTCEKLNVLKVACYLYAIPWDHVAPAIAKQDFFLTDVSPMDSGTVSFYLYTST